MVSASFNDLDGRGISMKLAPWNPVRIAASPNGFRCDHCGKIGGTLRELTVQGFMRKLREFERTHNKCAPAARIKSVESVALAAINNAKAKAEHHDY